MKSIKLNLDINELYILNDFVNSIIGKQDFQVELIVEEIFTNIVSYSNSDYIKVNASFDDSQFEIEFVDNGIPFNILLKKDPELPDNIDDAKIGGLGIFLTKQMADKIIYQYKNNKNRLKIIKNVE